MLYYKIFSNSIFFSIRPYYLLNDIDDQNDDDVDGVPISGHSSKENAKWAQSRITSVGEFGP